MRVGYDITPFAGKRTGVGTFCWHWAQYLPKVNPEIKLFGLSTGLGKPQKVDIVPFSRVVRVPIPTRILYKLWDTLSVPTVEGLIGKVDIYHATNYYLPPLRNARGVLTVYDLVFLKFPQYCSPKIVGPFCKNVLRFVRQAHAVITCSQSSKRDLLETGAISPDRVHVAYGGIRLGLSYPSKEEARRILAERYAVDKPMLLFVSTLEPRKNVTGLLTAFSKIAADFPHVLLLVGSLGWGVDSILACLKKIPYRDRVILPGYVPAEDLPILYAAADAFVFPSFYEGFGLPVLEALAAGCPVITSGRSSLPEVVGDSGILINPEDLDGLADAMRRVITDPQLQMTLAEKGRDRAKQFSWEKSAAAVNEVCRKVLLS